jgi:hypothetical protein
MDPNNDGAYTSMKPGQSPLAAARAAATGVEGHDDDAAAAKRRRTAEHERKNAPVLAKLARHEVPFVPHRPGFFQLATTPPPAVGKGKRKRASNVLQLDSPPPDEDPGLTMYAGAHGEEEAERGIVPSDSLLDNTDMPDADPVPDTESSGSSDSDDADMEEEDVAPTTAAASRDGIVARARQTLTCGPGNEIFQDSTLTFGGMVLPPFPAPRAMQIDSAVSACCVCGQTGEEDVLPPDDLVPVFDCREGQCPHKSAICVICAMQHKHTPNGDDIAAFPVMTCNGCLHDAGKQEKAVVCAGCGDHPRAFSFTTAGYPGMPNGDAAQLCGPCVLHPSTVDLHCEGEEGKPGALMATVVRPRNWKATQKQTCTRAACRKPKGGLQVQCQQKGCLVMAHVGCFVRIGGALAVSVSATQRAWCRLHVPYAFRVLFARSAGAIAHKRQFPASSSADVRDRSKRSCKGKEAAK